MELVITKVTLNRDSEVNNANANNKNEVIWNIAKNMQTKSASPPKIVVNGETLKTIKKNNGETLKSKKP